MSMPGWRPTRRPGDFRWVRSIVPYASIWTSRSPTVSSRLSPTEGSIAVTTDALVVMDVQNGVVDRFAEQVGPLLATLAETVAAARAVGVPVIYVRVAFRTGTPEVSPKNQIFSRLAGWGTMGEADPATQVHAAVAPQP